MNEQKLFMESNQTAPVPLQRRTERRCPEPAGISTEQTAVHRRTEAGRHKYLLPRRKHCTVML